MKIKALAIIHLFLLLVVSCGGGSSTTTAENTDVAEGGIGGTGISTGPLTGFGSIFVNGVKFDVASAEFIRDGNGSFSENDFSIGEYVVVNGTVNADGLTGTASKVIFEDIVEGVVTTASIDNVSISVLGQKVISDKLTVFIGFKQLTDLLPGNVVEVSGFRNAAGEINATGILLKKNTFIEGATEFELNGKIQSVDTTNLTFELGGLTVDYSQAALENITNNIPSVNLNVEVKSTEILNGNTFFASLVEGKNSLFEIKENTKFEIEGLVTQLTSNSLFSVNGQPVITNSETEFKEGAAGNIFLNVKVEVEGVFNSAGELVAKSVELRESGKTIEIEGTIQNINVFAGEFTVLGQQIRINSSTIFIDESSSNNNRLGIDDLVLGDRIEVKGNFISSGKILATRVDREDEPDGEDGSETELEGVSENINLAASTFSLFGITVMVNDFTEFEGEDDETLSRQAFFDFIAANSGIQVKAEGSLSNGVLVAEKIEIDD